MEAEKLFRKYRYFMESMIIIASVKRFDRRGRYKKMFLAGKIFAITEWREFGQWMIFSLRHIRSLKGKEADQQGLNLSTCLGELSSPRN